MTATPSSPVPAVEVDGPLSKLERLLLLPEWPNEKAWVEAVETAHALAAMSTPTPGRATEPDTMGEATIKASVAASEAGRVGKTTATSAYARVHKIDMALHDAIGMTDVDGPLCKLLEAIHSDVHDLAVDVAALRDAGGVPTSPAPTADKDEPSSADLNDAFSMIAAMERADLGSGVKLTRLVDGVETWEGCVGQQKQEFDFRDDASEWVSDLRREAKARALASVVLKIRAQIATTTKDRADGQ